MISECNKLVAINNDQILYKEIQVVYDALKDKCLLS